MNEVSFRLDVEIKERKMCKAKSSDGRTDSTYSSENNIAQNGFDLMAFTVLTNEVGFSRHLFLYG